MGCGCLGLRSLRHLSCPSLGSSQNGRPRLLGVESSTIALSCSLTPTNNWVDLGQVFSFLRDTPHTQPGEPSQMRVNTPAWVMSPDGRILGRALPIILAPHFLPVIYSSTIF